MRTFKPCRLRTGRILCNTCIRLPASVQTPMGKKDALKATASQSKYYKQNAKRTVSIPNKWTDGYLKKRKKEKISKTLTEIVNHSRSTALELQ